MDDQQINGAKSRIISRAWDDPEYKARLLSDPASVLVEAGHAVPDGVEVRVVENTDVVRNIVLRLPPAAGELSDDALRSVTAGGKFASPEWDPGSRGAI